MENIFHKGFTVFEQDVGDVPGQYNYNGQVNDVSDKVQGRFHILLFIISKLVVMAYQEQDNHITKMYHSQNNHYFTGSGTNACYDLGPGVKWSSKPERHGNITQVQQVISYQQHTVYKQGKLFISMQQVQNIAFAIPVKDQSNMYCYKPGNEQVNDDGQRVHNIGFIILTTLYITKVIKGFKLSNISER
jgi:hypothetical protein